MLMYRHQALNPCSRLQPALVIRCRPCPTPIPEINNTSLQHVLTVHGPGRALVHDLTVVPSVRAKRVVSLWDRPAEDAPLKDDRSDPLQPATDAFHEAVRLFEEKLTSDPKKRARIQSLKAARLQDVVEEVTKAQTRYETQRGDSKTRKCILAFSKRVHYYGKIMDVLVQHHPEYVSLAWGAMKMVFGVSCGGTWDGRSS